MYKEIICLEIEQTFSSQDGGRFFPKIRICKTFGKGNGATQDFVFQFIIVVLKETAHNVKLPFSVKNKGNALLSFGCIHVFFIRHKGRFHE